MTTVAIDAYELTASGYRGIGTYLRHLLSGLAQHDIRVTALAEPGAQLPAGVDRRTIHRRAPRRLRTREHDLLLPRELRRVDADVVHSPALNPPARTDVPWVQTLHDLTPLTFPHPVYAADERRWRRRVPRLREADAIIAVSQATADVGVRLAGLDPRRIHVIHHGVDPVFRPAPDADEPPLGDEPPYVLWVSSWGPHKGLEDAVRVLDRLADAGLPHTLQLVGWNDAWMRSQIASTAATSRHRERIVQRGFVDDLPETYRRAAALLVTSHAEGFCLPAVEAMACGTPVVAYDATVLPEVLGGAGALAPDGDVDALATALRAVLEDASASAALRAAGVARARDFSWEKSAAAHAELFRSVSGRVRDR